ncbi:ABC transporter ATP-binding protein [Pseudodesulfovibrio piezophilus]|uniref:ABC transporter related protein n=1 Tax=Pseudodesulfovibrio piezophilus (strain DSM 21447 / JCM 15486 / C1TLV30) TaxID=1322246 RepID=M1WXN3_PSEP2|nr:ABC transporter ATP-binding protein [Pseudodesulfovibrio piezophilus]CCH49813.1 ABC transporter related protein [Pseudodesulfovibrio piezophilus C1TLV30]
MSLTLDRVSFAYADGPVILKQASITIDSGTYCLVSGPSGAGKSTLLRLLCRLEEPQSGQVTYNGTPYEDIPPTDLRRSIAYVQQIPSLSKGTVRENLMLPFMFKANKSLMPPTDDALESYLGSFLLDCFTLETGADTLSVGQAQRLCLIRSLLLDPEIILMDEPTASLDPGSTLVVLEKAMELKNNGMTVVMISHSQQKPPGVTHSIQFNDQTLEYV